MENNKNNTFKTIKLEFLDLSNYTTEQIKSLQNGYNIYVVGTIGGCWEDEEFYSENIDDSDYKYFYNTFKNSDLYFKNTKSVSNEELWYRHNKFQTIISNTFDSSYSKDVINDRDYENYMEKGFEKMNTKH